MAGQTEGRTIQDLWDAFDCGDHLSDGDLEALMKSALDGVAYLAARRETLALTKTRMDLERLRSYQIARG